jgi:hypothetical protein
MASSKKTPSKLDRLAQRMQRYPSEGRLVLMRNLALGSAAACLAVLIQILQVGMKDDALTVSVLATAVGMPFGLAWAFLFEYYIFLGPRSYPHFRSIIRSQLIGVLGAVSGIALLVAVGGVLWHLLPKAAFVFAGVAAMVIVVLLGFHVNIACWWFSARGPGSIDSDIDT